MGKKRVLVVSPYYPQNPSCFVLIVSNTGTNKLDAAIPLTDLQGYGVDIDAVAGWLGSYKGEDSTSDISRGTPRFYMHCSSSE